jgi:excisionase family DNA binding protein
LTEGANAGANECVIRGLSGENVPVQMHRVSGGHLDAGREAGEAAGGAVTANDGRRDRLMDITGVADRLGVSVRYVRRLVAERRIPYIKLGHLLRFDPNTINEWLDKARVDEAWPERRRRPHAS